MGHLCDKIPDTGSRFVDVLIVVEMNFFLFEGADQLFRIPVLPRTPPTGKHRYLNVRCIRSSIGTYLTKL